MIRILSCTSQVVMKKAGLNESGFLHKLIVLKEDVQLFIILPQPVKRTAISGLFSPYR
jgi:hypothetical protein